MYRSVVRFVLKDGFGPKGRQLVQAGLASAALLMLGAVSFQNADAGEKARMPDGVSAVYVISFNGFNIGSFKFDAELNGNSYTLNGDAELSALLGAFHWRGISRASGEVVRQGPKPADYTLAFNGTGRSGSIKVGFDGNGVRSASVMPPFRIASDEVPLQRKHLDGALDPLTAVMVLTLAPTDKPCDQTLAIFDGKQRFDLKLAYREHRALNSFPWQTGRSAKSVVCSVDYQPLGGYRPTAQTQQLASSKDIEIAMLPVPSAHLVVPQEVRIPTGFGSVVLSAEKVSITQGRTRRVALLEGH